MNEEQAKNIYEDYCRKFERKNQPVKTVNMQDGSWLFVEKEGVSDTGPFEGVAIRADGNVFTFGGALGKLLRKPERLGSPKSSERFLGSTPFGCYQAFDGGFAIWEGTEDIGFPLLESLNPLKRQMCMVAFFDLRGFTSWSSKAASEDVQHAINSLETSIHDGFPYSANSPWRKLFLKGTGDGVMIVSQADWYKNAKENQKMRDFKTGHARKFLHACEIAILAGRKRFTHYGFPLALGCGIASGELDRVFLFGRFDFIGPAVNEAAKLQQHAWNEICISREFGSVLQIDGRSIDSEWSLIGKGWRLGVPSAQSFQLTSPVFL